VCQVAFSMLARRVAKIGSKLFAFNEMNDQQRKLIKQSSDTMKLLMSVAVIERNNKLHAKKHVKFSILCSQN